MKALLQRLHARLGDFWWYSLMIFMAARAADCLNVFVELWLVPKYVPPSELGAVQPLTNFASLLPPAQHFKVSDTDVLDDWSNARPSPLLLCSRRNHKRALS